VNGIANISAPRCALLGVFLDDNVPKPSSPPGGLNFSIATERDSLTLRPALRQPFFIGSGRTSASAVKQFIAPPGATRLFLGTMDDFQWANDVGSFKVAFTGGTSSSQPAQNLGQPLLDFSTDNPANWTVTGGGAVNAPALGHSDNWPAQSPPFSGNVISITSNGNSTGTFASGGSMANFDGFWTATYKFSLPADASNVSLTFSNLFADDRVVLELNGKPIAATGLYVPGKGSMVLSAGASAVPYSFNSYPLYGTVTSGFNAGGQNTLTAIINNTGTGMAGNLKPIDSGDRSDFAVQGTISCNSTAVQTHETDKIGILGPTANPPITESQKPSISTVLVSAVPGPNLAMSIFGSGFGATDPFIGTKSFLKISDLTGKWEAGHSGDGVNVGVSKWTDKEIVITNFSGFDYNELGTGHNTFNSFDKVEVDVQNAGNPGQTAVSTITLPAYVVIKIGPPKNFYVVLNNAQTSALLKSMINTLQQAGLCGQQPEVNISVGKASTDTARDLEILEFMIDLPDMAASGIQLHQDIEELGVVWAALNLANNQWNSGFPSVPSIAIEGINMTICEINSTIEGLIGTFGTDADSIVFGNGQELRITIALNSPPPDNKLDLSAADLANATFNGSFNDTSPYANIQNIPRQASGQDSVITQHFSDVGITPVGYVIDAQGKRSDISVIVSNANPSSTATPSSSAGPVSTPGDLTPPATLTPPVGPKFP
jgi:hypothetical protein